MKRNTLVACKNVYSNRDVFDYLKMRTQANVFTKRVFSRHAKRQQTHANHESMQTVEDMPDEPVRGLK